MYQAFTGFSRLMKERKYGIGAWQCICVKLIEIVFDLQTFWLIEFSELKKKNRLAIDIVLNLLFVRVPNEISRHIN